VGKLCAGQQRKRRQRKETCGKGKRGKGSPYRIKKVTKCALVGPIECNQDNFFQVLKRQKGDIFSDRAAAAG